MALTNKDLKRFKADKKSWVVTRDFVEELIIRMEASERINEKMGCGCCADYDELQEAKRAWREASGNLYSDEKPKKSKKVNK